MLKHITFAVLISSGLLAAASLPAQARPSASDCAYAQKMIDQGVPNSGHSPSGWYADQVEQCHE